MKLLKFFLTRTLTLLLIILIGMTAVFFIPRLMPSDPVEAALSKMSADVGQLEPEAYDKMREVLAQNFGLEGTMWEQYTAFIKRVVLTQDFGVSLSKYPTPVMTLIGKSLPWTMGLMLSSMIIAWLIGNTIGLLAGFRKNNISSKIFEGISIVLYPLPYYVFAVLLLMLFGYLIPIFPLNTIITGAPWSWEFIGKVIKASILPALSILLINIGWWMLSMKTLTQGIVEEDYIVFAKLKGIAKRGIMWNYVAPNGALPQVTAVALQLGTVMSGALVLEILFSYPGMGKLIYDAIASSDYNLILGAITVTILAVSLAAYLIDLLYPLLDPRIRNN